MTASIITSPALSEDQFTRTYSIKPLTYLKDFSSSPDGAKTTFEGVIAAIDWMNYFNFFKGDNKEIANKTGKTLDTVKSAFAVPAMFIHLNDVRRNYQFYSETDDPDASRLLFNSSMNLANAGGESAICAHSLGANLGRGLKAAKSIFWGSLFFLDLVEGYRQYGLIEELRGRMEKAKDAGIKSLIDHKLKLTYLNILKSVTTIAMAVIALTSIFFASIAQGFIFSPVVFLGLTTAWVVLAIITYFYERVIEDNEMAIPAGKV